MITRSHCLRVFGFLAGMQSFLTTVPAQELVRGPFSEPLVAESKSGETGKWSRKLSAMVSRPGRRAADYTLAESARGSAVEVSVLLNLGTDAYGHGYFSQSLALWPRAWKAGRNSAHENVRAHADRAFAEWMKMLSRLGRVAELRQHLTEVEGRNFRGGTGEMIQVARDALWVMENKPEVSFRCGPHALQRILQHADAANEWPMEIITSASPPGGIPLTDVAALSAKVGMNYQMARRTDTAAEIPVPAVVHWKLEHYGAVVKKDGGRYLLDDPTFGNGLQWIEEEALRLESSGYFLLPPGPLPTGWDSVDAAEGASVTGRGYPNNDTPGCVGPGIPTSGMPTPPPDPPPGDDDDDDDCDGGMAGWDVPLMMASLQVSDVPVGYRPPVGPAIFFPVQYNQRETNQPAVRDFANFGPLWNCDWIGSLTFDTATAYFNRGKGGIETFTGFDAATQSYAPGYLLANRLAKTGAATYELHRPDGGKLIFGLPNSAVNPTRIFMTQVVDPRGNAATLTYDSGFRLTGVTDAIGQTSTLTYGAGAESLLVKRITDPFGRFATFDYDAGGRLIKITDVIGLTSEFTYGAGDVMQTLKTGYGTTSFAIGSVNANRSVEITHPNGEKERIEQKQGTTPGVVFSEPAALVPKGFSYFNSYLDGRNTFHFDRKAMKEAPGDYTRARMYHFMHHDLNTRSPLMECSKLPGENRVWFTWQGQSNSGFFSPGVLGRAPARIARVLDDGSTQAWLATYNAAGNPLTESDPAGRQLSYTYAPNDVDVIEVRRKTGGDSNVRLSAATWDARHLPLTSTDEAGHTTTYTWNARSQLQTLTKAPGETWTLNYNPAGYHVSTDGPLTGAADTWTWTYDAAGRVRTEATTDGYTLTYDYDALHRLTKLTFPDGTYQETTWQLLDPASRRDRRGRVTAYAYDALRQLISETDPLGRTVHYEWCRCGALKSLTDAMGRKTSWKHDFAGRTVGKIFAGGTVESYAYDASGRLTSVTDPKGQSKVLSYGADDSLVLVSYSAAVIPTPGVHFTYDPWFPRLTERRDGAGITRYTYYPITGLASPGAGRLKSEDGPLLNDTIAFTYDAMGRPTNRAINGVGEAITYDGLNRVRGVTNALGSFNYEYVNATPRVASAALPNGQTSTSDYFPNPGDRRLKEIRHQRSGGANLSKFGYEYDAEGQLTRWTLQADSGPGRILTPAYDAADRLTSVSLTNPVQSFGYSYDAADNRLTESAGGTTVTATFNVLNETSSVSGASQPARSYEWDAEDRLAAVVSGTHRSEFSYDGLSRRIRTVEKENGTVISDHRFLWCGTELCEERNAAGDTVTKRFFHQGVALNSQPAAIPIFYSRDHLGSIRELTDSTGALRARYDYDPFGRRAKVSGDLDADFGFTGHYFHSPSGLHMALFRAYDSHSGRWINRDPIEEDGGINLFAYVLNDPLGSVDAVGLFAGTIPRDNPFSRPRGRFCKAPKKSKPDKLRERLDKLEAEAAEVREQLEAATRKERAADAVSGGGSD